MSCACRGAGTYTIPLLGTSGNGNFYLKREDPAEVGVVGQSGTIRAPHQLDFLDKSEFCDYCRIVERKNIKTKFICSACNLNFCFKKDRNHFRIWHSNKCDLYCGYT